MAFLTYWLVRILAVLFGLVPFRVVYLISDGLAWFLYRVVGYRRKVVLANLARCFPEKTEAERLEIAKESYRNLSDIMLESFKGITMSVPAMQQRYRHYGNEQANQLLQEGKSILVAGGHFNNWEWGAILFGTFLPAATVYGVYKPLNNPYMEKFMHRVRTKGGTYMLPMKETAVMMKKNAEAGKTGSYILVADQSPSNPDRAHWVSFFGTNTACLPGTDVLARKYNLPVFVFEVTRVKRGYYEVHFKEITRTPQAEPVQGITEKMMSMVESKVREKPSAWLWSHKRWKHIRKTI